VVGFGGWVDERVGEMVLENDDDDGDARERAGGGSGAVDLLYVFRTSRVVSFRALLI
jgi:hypothetical protein